MSVKFVLISCALRYSRSRRLRPANRDGRLQQYDTPVNVYHRPANTFVAQFVGSPSMNLIEKPDGILGIRPEDIELSTTDQPGWSAARVYVTEEMGNETLVVLTAGKSQITARGPAASKLDFDTPVWYRFRPGKLHWFDKATGVRLPDHPPPG